ncbi:hypothetical protein [Halobacillus sp. KGW1]|uniref:hypothetical protein n=1 Tax=Halobacillus sp. KGW1 TaxID=1793726 RepID=UPI0007861BFA|nr:hypothetical protein [Halobacillus sp. KGW1]
MNKDTFLTMTPKDRVKEVNSLLQEYDLKEISKIIGVPSSSFSKIMREGDYLYHQGDKQYYPFVRSEDSRVRHEISEDSDEFLFVKRNREALQKLIDRFHQSGNLVLEKKIYQNDAKFINKSIRMNSEIYKDFTKFCEEHYPYMKTQDIVAQALIDAMTHYKPAKETG